MIEKSDSTVGRTRIVTRRAALRSLTIVAAGLLVACGQPAVPAPTAPPAKPTTEKPAAQPAASGATPAAKSPAAPTGERKSFRLLTTETDPNSVRVLKDLIAEYEAQNPVRIEPEFLSWGDMYPKIMASVAAKTPPEVVYMEDQQVAKFAAERLLVPAEDMVNTVGRDRFYPVALQAATYDGKPWALPYTLQSDATFYRADWYQAAGIQPVVTWDDYLNAAKKLTNQGEGRFGTNLPMGSSRYTGVVFWVYIWTNGASIFDKNDNLVMDQSPNLERIAETLDFWKAASELGPPGIGQFTWLEVMQAYYTEKAAHSHYALRLLTQIEREKATLLPPTATQVVENPKGPRGERAAYMIMKGFGLMQGAQNVDEARKFVVWTMSDKARFIKYLHTVPGHLAPPLKDIAESSEYLQNPLIQANLPVQKKFIEILGKPTTVPFHWEQGGLHPEAVQLLDGPHFVAMVQEVILRNTDSKTAVRNAAEKLRTGGVGKKA